MGAIPKDASPQFPCGHERTVENSYFNAAGDRYRCAECANEKGKRSAWRRTLRGRVIHKDGNKRRIVRLKQEMITAYGGGCSCCGETESEFLTLEHLFRDGAAERLAFKKNVYTMYQTLKTWDGLQNAIPLCAGTVIWQGGLVKNVHTSAPLQDYS